MPTYLAALETVYHAKGPSASKARAVAAKLFFDIHATL
jgi:hypothetical protein